MEMRNPLGTHEKCSITFHSLSIFFKIHPHKKNHPQMGDFIVLFSETMSLVNMETGSNNC